jgi:hypothetical protein
MQIVLINQIVCVLQLPFWQSARVSLDWDSKVTVMHIAKEPA